MQYHPDSEGKTVTGMQILNRVMSHHAWERKLTLSIAGRDAVLSVFSAGPHSGNTCTGGELFLECELMTLYWHNSSWIFWQNLYV